MRCTRCQGLLIDEFEPTILKWMTKCVNCGDRSALRLSRPSARELTDPLLCYKCKVEPCEEYFSHTLKSTAKHRFCTSCRVEDLLKQRARTTAQRERRERRVA